MKLRLVCLYMVTIVNLIWANEISTQRPLLLNCRCSYGGLCLFAEDFKSYDIKRVSYQCNCEKMSENIYENCSILIDHCKKNMCQNNGSCVSRFGAATCTCPEPFKGQYCQINNSSLIQVEDPMVYFVINSPPLIKKKVFIMARSLGNDLKVTFKSGASRDYDLKKRHFSLKRQKDICRKDRFYEDPKACNLIKGNWMVAEIELSYLLPLFHLDKISQNQSNKLDYMPENVSKIYGKSDNVEVVFENHGVETYRHTYMFFYPYPTEVPYCSFGCLFEGCSSNPRKVPKILLDQTKSVQTFLEGTDGCDKLDIGGMVVINQSFSLIGPSKKIKNKHSEKAFKYYDLVEEEGPHEIENLINFVQKMLHNGKITTKYHKSVCKCYLDITFGELNFTFAELKHPFFCQDTLSLKLENLNKLLLIKDIAFLWSCDQMDKFCMSKFGKAEETYEGLRCDTKYKFTVLITHENTKKKSLRLEINIETKIRQKVKPPILNNTDMIPTEFDTYVTSGLKIGTKKHEYLNTTTSHVRDSVSTPISNFSDCSNSTTYNSYEKTEIPPKFDNDSILVVANLDNQTHSAQKQESTTDENENTDNDNKKNMRTICDGYGSKGKISPQKMMCVLPFLAIFISM